MSILSPDHPALNALSDIEARYEALLTAQSLRPDSGQRLVVAALQRLHDDLLEQRHERARGFWRLRRPSPPRGLYIYGGVGRGKSMLMDLFFAAAPVERKRRVHFHAFMQEIHAALNLARQNAGQSQDVVASVAAQVGRSAQLLCFDEFFVRDVADAMILGRLFTELLEAGVVLVATSNVAPDDLYLGGLQRSRFLPFIDLLKDRLEALDIGPGADYRRQHFEGLRAWHAPLGAQATAELERIFRHISHNATPAPATLALQGRVLEIPRAANGVAWFNFADLCERAVGVADYLALAKAYHTVVLDGIPSLSPELRNETARFIMLVDTMYEARARLFAAAAQTPDKLCTEGDHAFEFQRTASRLMEMQGQDYMTFRKIA